MVEIAETISDETRWAILKRKILVKRVAEAFRLFRSKGIEPILIKGLAADQFYPAEVHRDSVDIDLAVSEADYRQACKVTAEANSSGMAIDLHHELRHLDSLAWGDLFENARFFEADGEKIRVLRPEDHLRVLAIHWLNDGAVNRERLKDIYFLITNRAVDFDWQRALHTVTEKRRRWVICVIFLAEKYLGLDLAETPLRNAERDLPAWLVRSVESSWENREKEIPLWLLTGQPVEFLRQAKLRLYPNPVRATVEMEGRFDDRTRFFLRVGNFFQRLLPSVQRNIGTFDKRG